MTTSTDRPAAPPGDAPPPVSVIIPALDEAELLPGTLRAVAANPHPHEVIVVDGGSADATVAEARRHGARVIESSPRSGSAVAPTPGRAAQMNHGAAVARYTLLLFLHADTRLAPGHLGTLAAACWGPGAAAGGCFQRRFDHPSGFLRLTCKLADLRSRHLGWFLGDQGIFCTREAFKSAGGFPARRRFEDVIFSRRLRRCGATVTLGPPVVSSGRRFGSRPVWRTLHDLLLTARFLAGRDRP